ncbi:MAG: hypothetical protein NHB15_08060 [Methanosarcina barkeri]|nr:hypothetical protein [Methanosarcina sp. ERenArc_MAG2]
MTRFFAPEPVKVKKPDLSDKEFDRPLMKFSRRKERSLGLWGKINHADISNTCPEESP